MNFDSYLSKQFNKKELLTLGLVQTFGISQPHASTETPGQPREKINAAVFNFAGVGKA